MQNLVVGLFRIHELNIQCHCRVFTREGPQQRGQAVQANVVAGGQGQATAHFSGQIGQRAAGIIEHIENLVGPRQQGAPGFGQGHLTAQAVEQAHIQLLLEPGDALADGWLGQVQALAGARETAGFGDGDESTEVGQVHCLNS
ncbi:hypothetical protein D3C79_926450 [compost metagenome]